MNADIHVIAMQDAARQCARELLEAEAEIERLEQLLVTARAGLRTAHRLYQMDSPRVIPAIEAALRDSDPNRKVEG